MEIFRAFGLMLELALFAAGFYVACWLLASFG
jgi:hypothetical protein